MAEGGSPERSFKDTVGKASDEEGPPERSFKGTFGKASDEEGPPESSFKDTFGKASSDADEVFCEPCINRKKFVAVEGYCQICKEYMCGICLDVHRNLRMSRSHAILDKNQMPIKQRQATSQSLCTEICTTHHPEIIRYFCKAHNAPGCVDCMIINHATCKRDRVQDISDGFQATKEFKQIHQKLDKFQEELIMMKKNLDLDFNDLETSYSNIQDRIATFRSQVNDYLDEVQKQITDEAAKIKKEHEIVMNNLIAQNEALKSELEDRIQTIKNDSNMNSIFIHTMQAKQRLDSMEKELNTIKETECKQKHQIFRPSPEIQRILSAKIPLGELSGTPTIHTTLSYRGSKNVKPRKNQPEECSICICTLLNPQRMAVADIGNNKVNVIDLEADKIIFSYSTSSRPCGIATVNAETVAMTLPLERKIELLHVTSKSIKHHKYIGWSTTESYGTCITYHDDKFAVSYGHRVEVMNIHGKVLHNIQPKQGNKDVLQGASFIIFGHGTDTVIVSDDVAHTVSVVSFKGHVLHTYTHHAMRRPTGLALTADGILYVCSADNGCVHVVSADFKRSKIIINNDKHVVRPKCITYCDIIQRLYISYYRYNIGNLANSLQMYDLNI